MSRVGLFICLFSIPYAAKLPESLAATKIIRATAGLMALICEVSFHDSALFSLFQRVTLVALVAVAGMNKSEKRVCTHPKAGAGPTWYFVALNTKLS